MSDMKEWCPTCHLPFAGLRAEVRAEWDECKQHDVLFLLTIRPPDAGQLAEMRARTEPPGVMELYGLVAVRGAEVIELKDEGAHLLSVQANTS